LQAVSGSQQASNTNAYKNKTGLKLEQELNTTNQKPKKKKNFIHLNINIK
jgi:hypothetical protein